jgi:DNA-directed RNA polymerase sigma subunit (sigma70/sigma32)
MIEDEAYIIRWVELLRFVKCMGKAFWGSSLERSSNFLSAKEVRILIWRYYTNSTMREIGKRMRISHQRVEQIQRKALKKIRMHKKDRYSY